MRTIRDSRATRNDRPNRPVPAATWLVLLSFLLFCCLMGAIFATLSRAFGGAIPR